MYRRSLALLLIASFGACEVAGSNGPVTGPDLGDNDDGRDSPEQPAGIAPGFPGAGKSRANAPLENATMSCFYGQDAADMPVATIEHALEISADEETVHVRLTLDPRFVDNTYGETAIGWGDKPGKKLRHSFDKLVKSDHAELLLTDADGVTQLQFKIDYISADDSAPSGFATLGVTGGDGEMIAGDAAHVKATATSLDRNLNERGYSEFVVDSPATDENYLSNAAAPEWDYRVVYEAWVATAAFGSAGFGNAIIEYIHASPAKVDESTIVVVPEPCPPDWGCTDPDGCDDGEPPGGGGGCDDPEGCDNGEPPGDGGGCDDPEGCDNGDPSVCDTDDQCGPEQSCENGTCIDIVIG